MKGIESCEINMENLDIKKKRRSGQGNAVMCFAPV